MPPKANKPAAPKKPTKPSAKSKTGNTACSQAASNWQLSIRGKEPLDPQTYATLAKCRAMTRTAKQADDRARMGYNLNEQGAAALKGRLQKRFDQGLITQKSRDERLKMLLQQRKEKQAAVAAKPVTQTVEKLTGTRAVAQRFENAENKFVEHAMNHAGLTRPQAVTALNAMTKAKAVKIDPVMGQFSFTHGAFGDKAVIRRAAGIEPAKPADPVKSPAIKSIKGTYHVTQHERNAIYQGFEQNAKEWKTQRKHYKIQNQSESGALLVITDNPGKKNQAEQKVYVTFKSNQKPTDKAASLVSSVRQKPGYQNSRTVLADNNKREVREKLISTFVSDSIAGRRVPSRILDDMRDLRNAWISRAGGNDARLPDHNARPTFYMRPPVDAKGSEKRSLEKKADNVRKFWRVGENSEGGMDTTPLLHVAQASAAAKKAGKKHKLFNQPAFTLKQSSSQGGTGAGRSMGVLFQTEGTALDKAAQAGQKAPLPGQAGLFEKKPAFSRQGQPAPGRGTEERSEIAKQKWEDRPRRFLMGQTYLTKSGEPMLIHSKRQGYLTAFPYENGKPVVHSGSAIKFAYTDMAKKIAPDFRTDITNTPANLKETNNTTKSPKPFSRGGQLAPGRGTEERKNQSEYMIALRSGNQERIAVAKTKISERESDRIHHSYKQFRKFRDNTPRISVGREAGRNGYMPNQKKKIVYK